MAILVQEYLAVYHKHDRECRGRQEQMERFKQAVAPWGPMSSQAYVGLSQRTFAKP
ncbi:MAG: hypothetical protein U0401_19405 [Anaerolineae bacterium]